MNQSSQANGSAFGEHRDRQLTELLELKGALENSAIKADRRIELALSILDREMKLLGTAAPTKHINANFSGPKLDALYLDVREILLDLEDAEKQAALALLKDFAAQHKKPDVYEHPMLQPKQSEPSVLELVDEFVPEEVTDDNSGS